MTTHRTRIAGAALMALLVAGCSLGPTSKEQLCAGFDELDEQLLRGNAGFGNPLFDAVDDLAELAADYPQGVAADAAALATIGDDGGTDVNELRNATMQISRLCDRPPVGLGGLLRGPQ